MSTDIKIKKGLNIKLKGVANHVISTANRSKTFAVNPPEFHGVLPKLAVNEGDKVKVGDTVFYAKSNDQMKFVSPVSGEIKEIVRGAKRKILSIKISADEKDTYVDFDNNPEQN